MRDKEVRQDYRFMPEPNLPPLLLCEDNTNPTMHSTTNKNILNIEAVRRAMPTTFSQSEIITRLIVEWKIDNQNAIYLLVSIMLSSYIVNDKTCRVIMFTVCFFVGTSETFRNTEQLHGVCIEVI
jgi:aspartyl-tRNA(Asn)/glutamyl-tRNA(Gln) amidotransferase subunit B